jgi:hypothetical protein
MSSNILLSVLGLLMIDAIIEVGFIGSMVGYLHQAHNDVPFQINAPQGSFQLFPKPAHPIVNQGHTSNGAAGTAFVLVGIGGFLVLWHLRRRERKNVTHRPSRLFLTWTIFTFLSVLLTVTAIIYTFVVTNQTDNQTINFAIASANSGLPYPEDQWTPENWYKAVLKLPFAEPSQKGDIRFHVHLMTAWRWNLIPLLILGVAVACLAALHVLKDRRDSRTGNRDSGESFMKNQQR